MARYRKISPSIWNDAKFRSLSDNGKLVFFMLLTHPQTSAIGTLRAYPQGLAPEMGWSEKAFREAFGEAFAKGMVVCSEKDGLIWLPNFMKYNAPESPNVLKSWSGSLDDCPECPLKNKIYEHVKAFAEAFGEAFAKAFVEAFGQPSPNQEQEQEQEQYNTPPTPPQGEAVVVSSECEPVSSSESATPPTGKRRRKREGDAPSEYSPLFEEFWEAYPRRRRVNKFAAWKKFWAAQQAGILPDDIVQRVRNRQCEEDWAKEDGQYVPAPEVWLNKHGWEDEGCVWDPMGYKKLPQEIQDLMEEHYQWSLKLKHGMWQPGESQEEFDERYEKWQRINLEYTERIQAMGVSSYEPLP